VSKTCATCKHKTTDGPQCVEGVSIGGEHPPPTFGCPAWAAAVGRIDSSAIDRAATALAIGDAELLSPEDQAHAAQALRAYKPKE